MANRAGVPLSDFHGLSRLAIDAAAGLTGVVEAFHHNIARARGPFDQAAQGPIGGTAGIVYRTIRGATQAAGGGLDVLLSQLLPQTSGEISSPARDAVVSALNGIMGDHLAASGNPLAIPMRLFYEGAPLALDRDSLRAAIPAPASRLVVLVHGLLLNHRTWQRQGHDHGAALARDLGCTPVYLHYNSGLNISTNGRAFDDLLEALVSEWPVPLDELVIIGHSMGGLVARSACASGTVAGHAWPNHLSHLFFLGTPHHGAPLERGGLQLQLLLGKSPYTAALTHFSRLRSAGITDLRYGNLVDEDWQGRDRFAHAGDRRRGVPLPSGVQCHAIAATIGGDVGDIGGRLVGDGLVPVSSALGHHDEPHLALGLPDEDQWIGRGMHHLDLLSHPDVYEQIKRRLAPRAPRPVPQES